MAESSVALSIAVEPLMLALFSVSVALSIALALLQLLVVRLVCFSLPCQVRNGSSWCWWDDWHKSRFPDPRKKPGSVHGRRPMGKTFSYSKVPGAKAQLRGHLPWAVPLLSDTMQDNGFVKVSLDFITFGGSSVATAQKAIIAIGNFFLLVGPTTAVDS